MQITRQHYPNPGRYTALWRRVKAIAAVTPDKEITVWPDWSPLPASWIRAKFTEAMHARINTRGKLTAYPNGYMGGRKWADIYQVEQRRDCDNIRRRTTQRVIVRQIITPELRKRFQHIIWTGE